jgi:hypothetical protein
MKSQCASSSWIVNARAGNHAEATAIMKALEDRGLVNVVPELLIEKAAQLSSVKGHLEDRKLLP